MSHSDKIYDVDGGIERRRSLTPMSDIVIDHVPESGPTPLPSQVTAEGTHNVVHPLPDRPHPPSRPPRRSRGNPRPRPIAPLPAARTQAQRQRRPAAPPAAPFAAVAPETLSALFFALGAMTSGQPMPQASQPMPQGTWQQSAPNQQSRPAVPSSSLPSPPQHRKTKRGKRGGQKQRKRDKKD